MGRKPKTEIRKPQILEHFYHVLIEEGLQGASIAKIAKRMGVHPSLLIHYFSTKEEMVVELVDFILEKYEKTFAYHFDDIQQPEERLEIILDTILGPEWLGLIDDRAYYACYYLALRNNGVKKRFDEVYSRLRRILADQLSMADKDGTLKEIDPEKVASLIIVLMEGFVFLRNITEDECRLTDLRQFLKESALAIMKKETN
jgi:AcrR family transcriptional regulator